MDAEQAERKLAAIMFTDIVGSTAATARSESGGIELRDRHRTLVRARVERYRGHFVEAPGDESLSTFESAVGAVHAALAIQQELEGDAALQVRIGIHTGETMFRGDEVFGDGVNIAARIRPLAEPGGICVSDEVHHSIRNQEDIESRSLGMHELKNVPRPIEVFAVGPPGSLAGVKTRRGGRSRAKRMTRWAAAGLLLAAALAIAGYVLRRPLLYIVTPILMRAASAPYEQQIAIATTSDGVSIAYAAVGSGPTLVIVPGWITHLKRGLGSPVFDPITPRLRNRYQVVRYDQRGTGVSDRDVEDLSLAGRVRDLAAVIDAVGAERTFLFAASAGGPPAIVYTARHPERVTRLALFGTTARRDPDDRAEWQVLAAAARAGWGRDHSAVRKLFTLRLIPDADEMTLQGLNELQRMAIAPEDAAFLLTENATLDVTDQARRIRVPTLVMHVEGDLVVPFRFGRELAALIPSAHFLPIPGHNHLAGDQELPMMLDALEAWLAEDAEDP